MSYVQFKQRLDAGEVIVLDGGTGTELERRGVPMSPEAWCGPATLGNAELLTQIHLDYIHCINLSACTKIHRRSNKQAA